MKLSLSRLKLVNSKDSMSIIEIAIIVFLFAAYLFPAFSIGATAFIAIILMYCAYLVIVDKKLAPIVLKSLVLIVIIAVFYMLLTDTSSIAQNVSNRTLKRFMSKFYQYLTLYFPALLFLRVKKKADKRQKMWITAIGIAFMLYVIITTWIFLIENPNATREWDNVNETNTENIANYYFIYAVPIIIATITIIITKVKGYAKLIPLGLIAAGIFFLINAQYTLSILITIIGVLIQLFRNLRSQISKAVFLFAALLMLIFTPQILKLAIENIESEQVTIRLSEIYAFLTGQGAGGYNLNARLTLYGKTIGAFLRSPLWGNKQLGFDGHATFLTVLSDTGILGGIPFYALLSLVCKSIGERLNNSKAQFNVIVTMFIMMGLTNPVHASKPLGLATWFLAPLIISLIFEEDNKNETPLEN